MKYFIDELLQDLEVGKVYTERELRIFTINNREAILIGDQPYLDICGKKLYKVEDIREVYVHTGANGVYNIPSEKIKVISLSEEPLLKSEL